MKAVAKFSNGRAVLDLDDTPIPTEDFTLFLTPTKVKSGGSLSYKECKAYIKGERAKNTGAKTHFGDYTHMSTVAMNKLIESWKKKPSKSEIEIKQEVVSTSETTKEVNEVERVMGSDESPEDMVRRIVREELAALGGITIIPKVETNQEEVTISEEKVDSSTIITDDEADELDQLESELG